MNYRAKWKAESNNETNPNQNICIQAVCQWAGVADEVRYLHTHHDVKRALRKRFSVRSIQSKLGKAKTVGAARKIIAKIFAERNDLYAIYIGVPGHGMLLDRFGKTIVDTDPRKRDRRRLTHAHGLYKKAGL